MSSGFRLLDGQNRTEEDKAAATFVAQRTILLWDQCVLTCGLHQGHRSHNTVLRSLAGLVTFSYFILCHVPCMYSGWSGASDLCSGCTKHLKREFHSGERGGDMGSNNQDFLLCLDLDIFDFPWVNCFFPTLLAGAAMYYSYSYDPLFFTIVWHFIDIPLLLEAN